MVENCIELLNVFHSFISVHFVSIQEQQGGHGGPQEIQTITKYAKFGQSGAGGGTNEVYRPPRVAPMHYTETKRGSKKMELELRQSERRREVWGGV